MSGIPGAVSAPLNLANARIVDPVLSNLALGYSNTDSVGGVLFPSIPVGLRAGKIVMFGLEAFRLYNLRRAPGATFTEVEFGYTAGSYSLDQNAVRAKVPAEIADEAKKAAGIDLHAGAVSLTMEIHAQALEFDHAKLARNAANYDANHKIAYAASSSWWSGDADPVTDIAEAKEATRRTCGRYPNTMVLSPLAWAAARQHPKVLARFQNTDGVITLEQFARLVEIPTIRVGTRTYYDDEDGFQDIWGADVVMAWVNPSAQNPGAKPGLFQRCMPSFGYTYTLENTPAVEAPYYDQDTASWKYPNTMEQKALLTGQLAGFLFIGAGSR